MNEELHLGNIYTWNYWYSNEKGRMVVSTGTIEEFISLLTTDLQFEPDFRTVFVNVITLYSPIDTVMNKMIPRRTSELLNKVAVKNILLTLKLWLQEDPFKFTLLDTSFSKLTHFLKCGKKDAYKELKEEVSELLERARTMTENPIKAPTITMHQFNPRDFCSGFNDHVHFSEMMTYIHMQLFSKITETEIVQFFTKEPEATPNLKCMTNSFNWLSETLSAMANQCSISNQSSFFNFLMKTAEKFYEQKNFFGLCAIVFAFHKIPDFDYMKSNLSEETQKSIDKFDTLCSFNNNYQALRAEIAQTKPPLIPFIGILTKDLLVQDEMYASFISKIGHYNFNKLREIHRIAQQYVSYQDHNATQPANLPEPLFTHLKGVHGLH